VENKSIDELQGKSIKTMKETS